MYQLDLTDLPLDRLTEQKAKKRRGGGRQQSVSEQSHMQAIRGSAVNYKVSGSHLSSLPSHNLDQGPPSLNATSGNYNICFSLLVSVYNNHNIIFFYK